MLPRLTALRCTLLLALHGAAVSAAAETAPAPELPPAPTWDLTGNLRTAFGYKENILLSAVRSVDSPFARAEAEVFWWRFPTERFEALAFANAAVTRFTDADDNPREWQAFAHGEARWFLSRTVQATAVAEGYRLDQVFDLSATSAERATARLEVTGVLASAVLRWDLRPHTWLEVKPAAQRDRYRDGSDDNTQHLGRVTLGRTWFGGRLEVAAAGQRLRRDYASRPRYTSAGRPQTGTVLEFAQREAELRLAVGWDAAQRWRSTLAVQHTANDDNGSGYFDYRLRALRHELTWTRAPWKVRLIGRAGRYDYDVQTQGIGIDPPKRLKEEFLAQMRVERQWTPRAVVYADVAWERSRSNDPLARYRTATASTGVDWAF